MRKVAIKALYLFLCSILGMVLFAMLHRAIFVLYDLVLIYDFEVYSFGMNQSTLLAVDFLTMIAALFFGGWYGTVLGIDWYARVYGPNAEIKAGLFHGFIPHHWRGEKDVSQVKSVMPSIAPVTVKPTAKASSIKPVAKVTATKTATSKVVTPKSVAKVTTSQAPVMTNTEWNFDDFLKATPAPKKRAIPAKKVVTSSAKTATKTVRKTTAKKATANVDTQA